jgi:lipoteichoic acid synthase
MSGMPLRVGPLLFCACVGLYRAAWLSVQLSSLNPSEIAFLLLADLPVLGLLGLLLWLEVLLPHRWKLAPIVLSAAVVLLHVADAAAVVTLNGRLHLEEIRRFGGELWLLPALIRVKPVLVLLAAAGSFFVRLAAPVKVLRAIPAVALMFVLLPLVVRPQAIPTHLLKYTRSVLFLDSELWGFQKPAVARYTAGDVSVYWPEYEALFDAPIARSGTDIILIVVESLSAADSQRTSGLRDRLPRFDELSRKGVLFRNFFANFEASEGGLVSLLSGVPPVHFPTATTDTFEEYALQHAVVAAFKREGYRSELLTTVPLQFISMDRYARSPLLGFDFAGGQKEIPRFEAAPRYAFESPTDHLLYEELLARLPSGARGSRAPVFLTAVTASSHAPYVDPLGRENTAAHVWGYVQEELWWLYGELEKRGFFENGLLLITGDHRKMLPVQEKERDRFGESAKARVPLLIIGKGVPADGLDERMFQQSDLLRMLDRAIQPGVPLSPFVLWVERYVYVLGLASNASNLQIFDARDQGRQGFRLHLRGAEIEWVNRPSNPPLYPPSYLLSIERNIHRQRAAQQAQRTASLKPDVLSFGRDLRASDQAGILIGYSSDVNVGRDPDDPQGSLQTFAASSFALDAIHHRVGSLDAPFTLSARGFVVVPQDGQYWFSAFSDDESCLAIDTEIVLGCRRGLNQGMALLSAGSHRMDLRYVHRGGRQTLKLDWLPPGANSFADFPEEMLLLPDDGSFTRRP